MKRTLVLLSLLATAPAFAQSAAHEGTGFRVRIAYGVSSKFHTDGDDADLQGPEIGIAFPVGTFGKSDVLLEPSFFGGGRLKKGNDNDGDVYRLTLFAHRTFAKGIGARLGVGFATSTPGRGDNFDGTSSVIVDLGGEIPFSQKLLKGFSPYIDVHAIFGKDQVSGVFFGLGAKL